MICEEHKPKAQSSLRCLRPPAAHSSCPVAPLLCHSIQQVQFSAAVPISSFFLCYIGTDYKNDLTVGNFSIIKIAQFGYVYTGRPFLLQVVSIKYKTIVLGILYTFSLLLHNCVSNELKNIWRLWLEINAKDLFKGL